MVSSTNVNEFSVSNYAIYDNAQETTSELTTELQAQVDIIKSASKILRDPSVFAGPVAEECYKALDILDERVNSIISNFTSIGNYFAEVSSDYQKGDKAASLKIIAFDDNGAIQVTNYNANAMVDSASGWVWPLGKGEKWVLTSHNDGDHHGIDIATYMKQGAPIYCATGGTVIASGDSGIGYGNWVKVRLDNGLIAIYGHMSNELPVVQPGERISAGQVIGNVGTTGNSSGPHIHFELRKADNTGSLDPLAYYQNLSKGVENVIN